MGLFRSLLEFGRRTLDRTRPTPLDPGAGVKDLDLKAETYDDAVFLDPSVPPPPTPPEALAGKRFDLVLCPEVIEHVVQQQAFFADLAGWLAPGGLCLATTKIQNYKFDLAYLDPLMGHIAIHSVQSLRETARRVGFELSIQSFSDDQYHYLVLKRR